MNIRLSCRLALASLLNGTVLSLSFLVLQKVVVPVGSVGLSPDKVPVGSVGLSPDNHSISNLEITNSAPQVDGRQVHGLTNIGDDKSVWVDGTEVDQRLGGGDSREDSSSSESVESDGEAKLFGSSSEEDEDGISDEEKDEAEKEHGQQHVEKEQNDNELEKKAEKKALEKAQKKAEKKALEKLRRKIFKTKEKTEILLESNLEQNWKSTLLRFASTLSSPERKFLGRFVEDSHYDMSKTITKVYDEGSQLLGTMLKGIDFGKVMEKIQLSTENLKGTEIKGVDNVDTAVDAESTLNFLKRVVENQNQGKDENQGKDQSGRNQGKDQSGDKGMMTKKLSSKKHHRECDLRFEEDITKIGSWIAGEMRRDSASEDVFNVFKNHYSQDLKKMAGEIQKLVKNGKTGMIDNLMAISGRDFLGDVHDMNEKSEKAAIQREMINLGSQLAEGLLDQILLNVAGKSSDEILNAASQSSHSSELSSDSTNIFHLTLSILQFPDTYSKCWDSVIGSERGFESFLKTHLEVLGLSSDKVQKILNIITNILKAAETQVNKQMAPEREKRALQRAKEDARPERMAVMEKKKAAMEKKKAEKEKKKAEIKAEKAEKKKAEIKAEKKASKRAVENGGEGLAKAPFLESGIAAPESGIAASESGIAAPESGIASPDKLSQEDEESAHSQAESEEAEEDVTSSDVDSPAEDSCAERAARKSEEEKERKEQARRKSEDREDEKRFEREVTRLIITQVTEVLTNPKIAEILLKVVPEVLLKYFGFHIGKVAEFLEAKLNVEREKMKLMDVEREKMKLSDPESAKMDAYSFANSDLVTSFVTALKADELETLNEQGGFPGQKGWISQRVAKNKGTVPKSELVASRIHNLHNQMASDLEYFSSVFSKFASFITGAAEGGDMNYKLSKLSHTKIPYKPALFQPLFNSAYLYGIFGLKGSPSEQATEEMARVKSEIASFAKEAGEYDVTRELRGQKKGKTDDNSLMYKILEEGRKDIVSVEQLLRQ